MSAKYIYDASSVKYCTVIHDLRVERYEVVRETDKTWFAKGHHISNRQFRKNAQWVFSDLEALMKALNELRESRIKNARERLKKLEETPISIREFE